MSKLRILVGGEWIEVDADAVEVVQGDEVVDGEIVNETPDMAGPLSAAHLRREQLRKEAAWIDD